MAMGLLENICGVLIGFLMAAGAIVSGLFDTFGAPSAMLDAVFMPFSHKSASRHNRYKIDQFYKRLTRQSLLSRLRSDLLRGEQAFIVELRRASKRKENAVTSLFNEFAVCRSPDGSKIWTGEQFAVFIESRLGSCEAAAVLWRWFHAKATYPFQDKTQSPEEQHVDFDGWIQAIAILVTDVRIRNIDAGSRKASAWNLFLGCSVLSEEPAVIADEWHPPELLDQVCVVVHGQLPIERPYMRPPLAEVRPHVQKLVTLDHAIPSVDHVTIPYPDMLALVGVILRIVKRDGTYHSTNGREWPVLSSSTDESTLLAIAQGILSVGGIQQDMNVSFPDYFALSETFHSFNAWSKDSCCLEEELKNVWRGLFAHKKPLVEEKLLASHPPSSALQAIHLLYPFADRSDARDVSILQQSILRFKTDSNLGLCKTEIVEALTSSYESKLVLIYGTIAPEASAVHARRTRSTSRIVQHGEPALLAITTSSPLWSLHGSTAERVDFFAGNAHILQELAPRPRILWCATPNVKYSELVNVAKEGELSFLDSITGATKESIRPSGMTINFDTGIATLNSSPPSRETNRQQRYVELHVGPQQHPTKRTDKRDAWTTTIQISKIEIYGESRIFEHLVAPRRSMSTRSSRRRGCES